MVIKWKGACAAGVLLAGGALLSSACVKNEGSLFVQAVIAPSLDSCEFDCSGTATFYTEGAYDGSAATDYSAILLVGNQLVARGDPNKLRVETSRVELYGADVTVLNASDQILTRVDGSAAQYSVDISGFANPGTNTSPGFGCSSVLLIDHDTAADLACEAFRTGTTQRVTASVVIRGRSLGGQELTSAEFKFPIEVGYLNLCAVPGGVDCASTTDKPAANCQLGLNTPVDCRFYGVDCDTVAMAGLRCFTDRDCACLGGTCVPDPNTALSHCQ